MQLTQSFQQNRVHYKNYLLLLLLCILAYWPLSFGVFSVKNDAIHYFLPYRFSISEALRNGEWPFWSPYIYNGNPIMGDMQSGAWNPVVWIFSAIGRYDITLFHFENLLYIFLGAAGMYKLSNMLVRHSGTAFLLAGSYMLCGFMLGGQLINWLAAAAFLPFVLHYYLLTIRAASYINAVKAGIALYFLFTAGYPSFFILTAYLLLFLFLFKIVNRVTTHHNQPKIMVRLFLSQLLLVLVFTGLSLPAILSFADLLPYYERGAGTSYAAAASNAFDPQHFLTLLFPATIKSNDIVSATDITCRNIYFGLLPLLLLVAIPPRLNRRNILLILLALFSILFSMGNSTPVRELCYRFVPLLDTFRHPSQMRLFFILAVLLLAAPGVKRLLTGELNTTETKRLKVVTLCFASAILVTLIAALTQSTLFSKISQLRTNGIRESLKNILESVSLADTIVLSAIIQLVFLAGLLIWYRKIIPSAKWTGVFWIANLFIMAQLVLPASFVSKVSPKEINATIHASPKGYPVASLQYSLAENSKDAFDRFPINGLQYFYNKKPGISKVTNSPAFLAQMDQFHPVVYLADSVLPVKDTGRLLTAGSCNYAFTEQLVYNSSCRETDQAVIKKLSSSQFVIETTTADSAFLVLTQNYYPHWRVTIDGNKNDIIKTNISFMGVVVPAGKHTVAFRFEPVLIKNAVMVQLAIIFLLIIAGFITLFKHSKKQL
jgi:hypothetical protein